VLQQTFVAALAAVRKRLERQDLQQLTDEQRVAELAALKPLRQA